MEEAAAEERRAARQTVRTCASVHHTLSSTPHSLSLSLSQSALPPYHHLRATLIDDHTDHAADDQWSQIDHS